MSDLVKSKRLAAARGPPSPAASSHLDGEDENLPNVSATPNESSSTATPKPGNKQPDRLSKTPEKKMTLTDIKKIVGQTAWDITTNLTTKHEAEMKIQLDAVQEIQKKFERLQESTRTQNKPHRSKLPEPNDHKIWLTNKFSPQASKTG